MKPRIAIVATHPVQYHGPWFAHLAGRSDLSVFYAHRQTPEGQSAAGFTTRFEWDVPLLDGYEHRWLQNVASNPGLGRFGGCDTPEIGEIIRRARFDAVVTIGWNKKSFLQAGLAARRAGSTWLVRLDSHPGTPRSLARRLVKWPFYSSVLPWAAHYLSPGRRSDEYLRRYRVPNKRIHRVAHMVDTVRFGQGADRARADGAAAQLRARLDTPADAMLFLFVGKLGSGKRPQLLLEALAILKSRGEAGGLMIWFAGDGPLDGALQARAKAQDLPVRFLGFVNQSALPAVYAAADCLILPSVETWGLVVNEAFACGIPAIVSHEAGCAPDLIEEDVTGWTLRSADAPSLADLLRTALRKRGLVDRENLDACVRSSTYETGTQQLLDAMEKIRSGDGHVVRQI